MTRMPTRARSPFMFSRQSRFFLATFSAALLAFGCASVNVKKVPTPTQYIQWNDQMQHKADKMEGLRFYLPRPFVSVFESFPIRTDIYLANGIVSPDNKYVLITSVTAESGLSRYVATDPREVEIPTNYIFEKSVQTQSAKAKKESANSLVDALVKATNAKGSAPTGVVGTIQPEAQAASTPPAPEVKTGIDKRKMTNDNGAFAYQPLRGNFDLVYLPDFEEQYVISSHAGLGNATFAVNLGQGWSLQGFDSLVDNSELNKRIFSLIDGAMRLAQGAASTFLGLPGLLEAEPGIVRPQSTSDALKPTIPGTPVTLKIVVVHYAAKGLYPVIKPRELQERALSENQSYCVLDLFKTSPKVTWASSFDPTAITRAQEAIDNQTGNFTVPRYPYQYVSFNTFRYMAIEVVRPTDDKHSPFQHLYDKTGTTGSVGDARTGEIDKLLKNLLPLLRSDSQPEPLPPADEEFQELEGSLAKTSFNIDQLKVTIKHANFEGSGVFEVQLTLSGDPGKTTIEMLAKELKIQVETVAEKQAHWDKDQLKEIKDVSISNLPEVKKFLTAISDEDVETLNKAAAKLTQEQPEVPGLTPVQLKISSAALAEGGILAIACEVTTAGPSGGTAIEKTVVEGKVKTLAQDYVTTKAGGTKTTLRNITISNWDGIKDKLTK